MKTLAFFLSIAVALQVNGFGQTTVPPAPPSPAPAATPQPSPSTPYDPFAESDAAAKAQHAAARLKWNICVDVQMVAMEESKALDLIPELESDDRARIDSAWTKIQAMIKGKEAILQGWPMVRTADGERAVTESINEKRYVTEFEPPSMPSAKTLTAPVSADNPSTLTALPTAFETRNVGATLEVEPSVLDDGKRVNLNIASQRVELLEMEKVESVTEPKTIVNTPQPLFAVAKTTQALNLLSGQRQLIGVYKLTRPANYIEFHIVRAVVSKME